MRAIPLATVAMFAVVTTGCTSSDDRTARPSGDASYSLEFTGEYYSCSQVWVVGETLPSDYAGCFEDDGNTKIDSTRTLCTQLGGTVESLDQEFYAGNYVAELGGEVELDPDRVAELEAEIPDCQARSRG